MNAGPTESDIDIIAVNALSHTQLSAALNQQVSSPNRVFSTPSCYAALAVGFPDCVNVIRLIHKTSKCIQVMCRHSKTCLHYFLS